MSVNRNVTVPVGSSDNPPPPSASRSIPGTATPGRLPGRNRGVERGRAPFAPGGSGALRSAPDAVPAREPPQREAERQVVAECAMHARGEQLASVTQHERRLARDVGSERQRSAEYLVRGKHFVHQTERAGLLGTELLV